MLTAIPKRFRALRGASAAIVALAISWRALYAVPPDTGPAYDRYESTPKQASVVEPVSFSPILSKTSAGDFEDVGGDTCGEAEVIDLPVGPPGSPIQITLTGDSSGATGPDCDGALDTVWWEAFHTDTCATITIDFCGSPPRPGSETRLANDCDDDDSPCGTFLFADFSTQAVCGDANVWMSFTAIPPGTYYYPVRAHDNPPLPFDPYVLHISAEQCQDSCEDCFGACCDSANHECHDGVLPTACTAPGQEWLFQTECCEIECVPPEVQFDSMNVEMLGRIPIAEFPAPAHSVNEIWGYKSPSGREYAILGFTTGTAFVDVTNPDDPFRVEEIEGHVDSTWRDMDVVGHYAYIVSDGVGVGLQIVDLSEIDSGIVTLVNTTDLGVGYATAHNIRANPESGFLYLAIPNINDRLGITALDLADPVNPVVAGTWIDSEPFVRCHDIHVVSYTEGEYAGREIAFCFAESRGVKIVDVTDKSAMFTLSTLLYPTVAYTHQGWLSEDRRYLFIDDELDERVNPFTAQTMTYVGDVQDLENPVFLTSFTSGVCAIDHNLTVKGQRVYEANYTSGLRVFDFSDIDNIEPIAYFDSHPGHNGLLFDGSWGVFVLPSGTILLSDRQEGLFVLRLTGNVFPPGDCNGDDDFDLRDFARLQECFTGPGAASLPDGCLCADLGRTGEVDLLDLAAFVTKMTGPNDR